MQVVEPRLEPAAEVVPIPLLWRGARQGGVVEPRLPAAGRSGTSGREKSRAFGELSGSAELTEDRVDGLIQGFLNTAGLSLAGYPPRSRLLASLFARGEQAVCANCAGAWRAGASVAARG